MTHYWENVEDYFIRNRSWSIGENFSFCFDFHPHVEMANIYWTRHSQCTLSSPVGFLSDASVDMSKQVTFVLLIWDPPINNLLCIQLRTRCSANPVLCVLVIAAKILIIWESSSIQHLLVTPAFLSDSSYLDQSIWPSREGLWTHWWLWYNLHHQWWKKPWLLHPFFLSPDIYHICIIPVVLLILIATIKEPDYPRQHK